MQQRDILRIAGFGALLFIIAWLAWSTIGRGTRYDQLNAGLKAGTIGLASEEDRLYIERRLAWLLGSKKISYQFNKPYKAGVLNIYVTTSEAKSFTKCDVGNALYDSSIDTIFIDSTLVDQKDLIDMYDASIASSIGGMKERIPFYYTYFDFVVLHELGHRSLHRNATNIDLLRRKDEGRRLEAEADQYAASSMRQAYEHPAAVEFIELSRGEFSGVTPATVQDKVAYDATQMAIGMTLFSSFTSNPFAPFYQDTSHPTFVERATSLLNIMLEQPDVDVNLISAMRYMRDRLTAMHDLGGIKRVELIFENPLLGLGTIGNNYVFKLFNSDSYYTVEKSRLHGVVEEAGLTLNTLRGAKLAKLLNRGRGDVEAGIGFQEFYVEHYDRFLRPPGITVTPEMHDCRKSSLAETLKKRVKDKIHYLLGTTEENAIIEYSSFFDQKMYFIVKKNDASTLSIIATDSCGNEPHLFRTVTDLEGIPDPQDRIHVIPLDHRPRIILLSTGAPGSKALRVYEANDQSAWSLRMTLSYATTDERVQQTLRLDSPRITRDGISWLRDGLMFVNIEGDLAYILDLERKRYLTLSSFPESASNYYLLKDNSVVTLFEGAKKVTIARFDPSGN